MSALPAGPLYGRLLAHAAEREARGGPPHGGRLRRAGRAAPWSPSPTALHRP